MIQMKSLLFKWFKLCFWNTYAHTNTHRNTSHVHFACVCGVLLTKKKIISFNFFFGRKKRKRKQKSLCPFVFHFHKFKIIHRSKEFFFLGICIYISVLLSLIEGGHHIIINFKKFIVGNGERERKRKKEKFRTLDFTLTIYFGAKSFSFSFSFFHFVVVVVVIILVLI